MSKKTAIGASVAAALVLIIVVVTAVLISRDMKMGSASCELYFLNEAGTSIAAEEREIRYKDVDMLAQNLVVQLLKGPENSRHRRLIDKKTSMLNLVNEGEGRFVVDFSSEFLSGDNTRNMQAAYSVVKSMCSIDGVRSVKVLVEGSAIAADGGGTIGYLRSQDINISADSSVNDKREATLYFAKKDSDKLCRTTRVVKIADQKPLAHYIINELIKGADDGYEDVMSKRTKLISVDTEGGICFVNFGEEFLKKNGRNGAEKTVYAIVNSLTELENVDRVQFLVEGRRVERLGEVDISGTIERNEGIIE